MRKTILLFRVGDFYDTVMKRNLQSHNGIWLLDITSLALAWSGSQPVPKPTAKERIRFAMLYIRSKGNGPRFIDCMKRLAKAVAFCLKPLHVSWSGKPMLTTGRSIEEEWANFSLTECVSPHSGHGNLDSLDAKSSSLV